MYVCRIISREKGTFWHLLTLFLSFAIVWNGFYTWYQQKISLKVFLWLVQSGHLRTKGFERIEGFDQVRSDSSKGSRCLIFLLNWAEEAILWHDDRATLGFQWKRKMSFWNTPHSNFNETVGMFLFISSVLMFLNLDNKSSWKSENVK